MLTSYLKPRPIFSNKTCKLTTNEFKKKSICHLIPESRICEYLFSNYYYSKPLTTNAFEFKNRRNLIRYKTYLLLLLLAL